MAHGTDWYPNSRDGQLHMIDTWLSVFQTRAAAWNIPAERITALTVDRDAARAKLAVVKSGERTAASVVECSLLFKAMETEARFIKKHYLLVPPLTLADLPALLLPLPDDTYSPVGPPTGQPALTITYPGGPHLLTIHLAALAGTEPLSGRRDYGFALYKGVMPQGGASLEQAASSKHYLMAAPLSGEDLLYFIFTRRKTEVAEFGAAESAFFCARYENQKGAHGAWGPAVSAIIP